MKTITVVPLLLLLVTPLRASSELQDSPEDVDHAASSAQSGEPEPQVLEDEEELSASSEVLDSNHAWFPRRRRSLRPSSVKDLDDLEAAESVVFMPAHLRHVKKTSIQECRTRLQEHMSKGSQHHYGSQDISWQCNPYCCYPVVSLIPSSSAFGMV